MKGVVLAGGSGTRLKPLTELFNKHLLPVGRFPMIHYPLFKIKEAGIADVIVVTGPSAVGKFAEYLGSGARYGIRLAFCVQDEPGGIAQALASAEPFVAPEDRLLVLLGDNLFEDNLEPYVRSFAEGKDKAFVFLKKVRDPRRYGVPSFGADGRIAAVEEKPVRPRSDYGVTGIYLYDRSVFDVIRSIRPSERGELEITDVNNRYAERGELGHAFLRGWWTDAGTPESWLKANLRVMGKRR